ncbi:MAG: BACON domain-containing protein [Tannerellaceae bacterium]
MRTAGAINKKSFLSLLLLSALTLSSCKDDSKDEWVEINVSAEKFEVGPEGGEKQIIVEVNTNWSLVGTQSWCSASPTSGSAAKKDTITIKVSENTTYAEREANLKIKALSKEQIIQVIQAQKPGVLFKTDKYIVPQKGNDLDVYIDHNVEYKIKIDESSNWIRHTTTKSLETDTTIFSVSANNNIEDRIGYVIAYSTTNSLDADTMTIIQRGIRSESERDALIALYENTNGENWINQLNWNSDQPVSSWYGITTHANGSVKSISLISNRMRGEIPTSIADLTALEAINLSTNNLSGTLPLALGKISNLQTISLTGNNFTGSIPVSYGSIKYLTVLILDQNKLSGDIPSEVLNCKNWDLWDSAINICPQQEGYGFTNCK